MGKTSTERSKEFRKKMKLDPVHLSQQRAKDRLRWKQRSEAKKNKSKTTEELKIHREKERLRKAKWRQNKLDQSKQQEASTSYSSPASLGKAVARVKRKLPKESEKKVEVIAKVIADLSPTIKAKLYSSPTLNSCGTRKTRSNAISDETVKKVQSFFERDDISRMCPGQKDFIIIREGHMKTKVQKRILQMTIREAYSLFCESSDIKIGISSFHKLRPKHIVPVTEKDREVCYCIYHENLDLLLAGFKKTFPYLNISNIKELLKSTVCDYDVEMKPECADRKFQNCSVDSINEIFQEIDGQQLVTYYQWVTGNGKSEKSAVTYSAAETIEILKFLLTPFSRHVYNMKRQFQEFSFLKDNLKDKEIIIIEDFAENFSIHQQNEIMNAHWHSVQVTIFAAVVYSKENDELKHLCYGIEPDDKHDKGAIVSYNSLILKDVQENLSITVEKVHYWSDGPSNEFKNHFVLGNLVYHKSDFG